MTVTVSAFQRHGFQFTGFQEAGGQAGGGDIPWYVKYEFGRLARRFTQREEARLAEEKRERERREAEVEAMELLRLAEPIFVPIPPPPLRQPAPIVLAPPVEVVPPVPVKLTSLGAVVAHLPPPPPPITAGLKYRARERDIEMEEFHELMVMLADAEEFA